MPIVPRDTDAAPDTTALYEQCLTAMRVEITGQDETLADQAYAELLIAGRLTTAELARLISRAGRVYAPKFLAMAYRDGKVSDETVTALVGPAWSEAEYPDQELDRDTWRWLFDVAGFTVDGKTAPRPESPMRLYRGAVPERREDWSWSRDIKVALKFAAGVRGRPPGRLWVCSVPPAHMLAINTERDEDEIVVDTRGLDIAEASA